MLTNIIILIFVFAGMLSFFLLSPRFCSYLPKRQIFSPWNTTLIVWIIILTVYCFAHKELYAISQQFIICLTVWMLTFTTSSILGFILTPSYKKPKWSVCEKNVDIITIATIILVPIAVYKAIQHAFLLGSPEDLFLTLREQAIDPEQNQLGIVKYFVYVINVMLIVELSRNKLRKWRLILVIILCFLFFIATMGKSTLFMYLFSGLYILYEKKKISLRPIIFGALFLILLIPTMYFLRGGSNTDTDTDTIINILMIYIISSIVAFGYVSPHSSFVWGENIFRPFYNILNILGLSSYTPQSTIQDFCYVPLPTNVYTVLSPFYKDFGESGIFIFALIEGLIIGIIYKYSKSGCNIVSYLYAYIFTMLVMQFFDELFFQGISSILQIFLIILFCHIKIKLK